MLNNLLRESSSFDWSRVKRSTTLPARMLFVSYNKTGGATATQRCYSIRQLQRQIHSFPNVWDQDLLRKKINLKIYWSNVIFSDCFSPKYFFDNKLSQNFYSKTDFLRIYIRQQIFSKFIDLKIISFRIYLQQQIFSQFFVEKKCSLNFCSSTNFLSISVRQQIFLSIFVRQHNQFSLNFGWTTNFLSILFDN